MVQQPKNFWERPEGTTGKLFLIVIFLVGGWFLYRALPTLITLMENTLYAGFLAACLFVVVILLLDKRFQTLLTYAYRSLMRGITKLFIELDPIAIIDNYIEDLKKNLFNMEKQITNLRSQMGKLKQVIDQNKHEREESLQFASVAKQKGNTGFSTLKTRQAGRLEKSNITLETLLQKMEMLYRVLTKYRESASLYIEDLTDEVSTKKREAEAIKAGHNAFRSAMKVIKGDPDRVSMFEQAMQILADDVGSRVGEMEQFMEMSRGFIDTMDIQNGIFEENGLKMLEEWEKNGTSFFFKEEEKQQLLLDEPPRYKPQLTTDYTHILKK